ncbi:CaiB/BaiF CoA transferase family protein [Uliginosibacterium sp. sgz301328]|uniref:CaiB/BaiF CoA transferase family protein n=1 Tax=Uliginosibacterium sp. sgz301328 TaxID=3243764 RepID=UPI00359E9B4D
MTTASLPLAGLRVVEFAHMVMGPACGLILADMGAEVIKVEGVEGDSTRRLTGSGAGYWPTYNRNKLSLAVDLKSVEGLAAVLRLIDDADVLIENFRPGAMARLGLGYEALRERNLRLIYCSLKGFLPGPYEQRTALDEVVQMMGGLAYMTGPPGRPLRAGASVNDVMGGMFGAIAVLAALNERSRTGRGQLVQSGLFENNVFLVAQHMLQGAVTGRPAEPMPTRLSAWAVYDVFETADDERVFVGAVSDAQWLAFCTAFGLRHLADDAGLATNNQRVHARDQFMPFVREHLRRLSRDEIMRRCDEAGLPFAPIARPQDLYADPHLAASEGFTTITLSDGATAEVPRLPVCMDGRRFATRVDLPPAGRDTAALLRRSGYAEEDIAAMSSRGVVRIPDVTS